MSSELAGPYASNGEPGQSWGDMLDLLAEVLSRADGDPGSDDFYGPLCEVVCRLVRCRRALIFRYDAASRRVRAAGAHGLELANFADAHFSLESAPITAEALRTDKLVEIRGDLRPHFSSEFAELVAEPGSITCAPIGARGRAIGVILAERSLDDPPLAHAERQLLWTLGKAIALATMARITATQAETAKQLEQRIDLAREVHEGVVQRMFGVSLALDGDGDLPAEARRRCAAETQAALSELRSTLRRPLGRSPRATQTTLVAEVARLNREHPRLGLMLIPAGATEVPDELEPLAQSVLTEAVRNAQKHAQPTVVEVRIARADGTFTMDVINDGVGHDRRTPGIGLRLAAFEALQAGGVIEFGEREPGSWRVRLVVPCDG